jgi:hypothetical protein
MVERKTRISVDKLFFYCFIVNMIAMGITIYMLVPDNAVVYESNPVKAVMLSEDVNTGQQLLKDVLGVLSMAMWSWLYILVKFFETKKPEMVRLFLTALFYGLSVDAVNNIAILIATWQ